MGGYLFPIKCEHKDLLTKALQHYLVYMTDYPLRKPQRDTEYYNCVCLLKLLLES